MINALVTIQVLSMIGLGTAWSLSGNWRLGVAQGMYCVATIVLFAKA